MVLQHLVNEDATLSEVQATLPRYTISKNKLPLGDLDPDALLANFAERYRDARLSTIDGVKIDLDEGWVHLRKSNTEPILRIYAEAATSAAADALAQRFMAELQAGTA
jgi:phosphomannomutase